MADLSADTRQLIADRLASSSQLTGDYAQDEAKGLFKEFKPTDYDFGLNAQNDAIAKKAKAKFYDPTIENLVTQQKANYAGDVQKQMKSAQQLGMGQLRYDNARALAAQQRVAQEEAQRAAMISSLFQVGGTIGGAMLGGPVGAGIGGAAGGALGRQSSGAQPTSGGGYMNTAGRTA